MRNESRARLTSEPGSSPEPGSRNESRARLTSEPGSSPEPGSRNESGRGYVVGVTVGDGVGLGVGVGVAVGVGLGVAAWVAGEAWAAVGEAGLTGVYPADWDVGCLAGVCVGLEVFVRVAGDCVEFPRSDAVGETPLCVPPDECAVSRTPSTAATITTAATAVMGQRHRRNGDGRLTGGVPAVPPGMSRPAAVAGPGTARDVDVSGRWLYGMTAARTVGS